MLFNWALQTEFLQADLVAVHPSVKSVFFVGPMENQTRLAKRLSATDPFPNIHKADISQEQVASVPQQLDPQVVTRQPKTGHEVVRTRPNTNKIRCSCRSNKLTQPKKVHFVRRLRLQTLHAEKIPRRRAHWLALQLLLSMGSSFDSIPQTKNVNKVSSMQLSEIKDNK